METENGVFRKKYFLMKGFCFIRNSALFFCLYISSLVFSQKKITKNFETFVNEISISTIGLDDIILENSDTNFIEITLFAENPNDQHIIIKEEYNLLKIDFKILEEQPKPEVFRKFITKRLHNAYTLIKIPKNKTLSFFGDNINIESKSYAGNLKFFIEKGILKLNETMANTVIKMYAGSIYANISKVNAIINSNMGRIHINEKITSKKYQKNDSKLKYQLLVHTIKGNIFLTTE